MSGMYGLQMRIISSNTIQSALVSPFKSNHSQISWLYVILWKQAYELEIPVIQWLYGGLISSFLQTHPENILPWQNNVKNVRAFQQNGENIINAMITIKTFFTIWNKCQNTGIE